MTHRRNTLFSVALLAFCALALTGSKPERGPSDEKPTPQESQARRDLAKTFPGRIIFDSNRGRGFGIFITDVTTDKIVTFSDTEEHEMYPDVSPDGKWVVFARSSSVKKRMPGEIWIAPATGGNERKLAENATFPTFSSDGKMVYFERARERAMKLDLATGKESEIFPLHDVAWHEREVVKPRVSPDGRYIAFISKQPRRWSSWYADLKTGQAVMVGKGCEPTWFAGSDRITWVGGFKAMERSGFGQYNLATKEVTVLQDAPAPRGHEYFPRLVEKNKYLLYSAAREGEHDPITANYQLFVKDLSTNVITRITFDPHTNRWPTLFPG